jgi:hypothetical protein
MGRQARKLGERRRQRIRQMAGRGRRSPRGGRAEAKRKARRPFIGPAHLRAGFDIGGDAVIWFAVWNPGRNLAIAIDLSSDELEACEQSLRSARRAWGDHYAGPFPSRR